MKAIQNTYAKSASPGNRNPGNGRKQEFLRHGLFLELTDQFLVICDYFLTQRGLPRATTLPIFFKPMV